MCGFCWGGGQTFRFANHNQKIKAAFPFYGPGPTTEAGVKNIEVMLWTAFLGPAGTPPAVVRRIRDEVARVVKLPEVRERFAGMGIDPVANMPNEFRRIMAADIAKWTAVAKAANIKAE